MNCQITRITPGDEGRGGVGGTKKLKTGTCVANGQGPKRWHISQGSLKRMATKSENVAKTTDTQKVGDRHFKPSKRNGEITIEHRSGGVKMSHPRLRLEIRLRIGPSAQNALPMLVCGLEELPIASVKIRVRRQREDRLDRVRVVQKSHFLHPVGRRTGALFTQVTMNRRCSCDKRETPLGSTVEL